MWKHFKYSKNSKDCNNSAVWSLLDAIGIYSWSFGCLPIIPDFGEFNDLGLIWVVILLISVIWVGFGCWFLWFHWFGLDFERFWASICKFCDPCLASISALFTCPFSNTPCWRKGWSGYAKLQQFHQDTWKLRKHVQIDENRRTSMKIYQQI